MALECGGDLSDRVEAAGVHVAGLGGDDERPFHGLDGRARILRPHAALVVGRNLDHPIAAEAEVLERGQQGGMCLLTDDDGDLGRSIQALGLDVPVFPRKHRVAPRGKSDRVAQPGAGGEAHAGIARQPEQLEHPGACGSLYRRGGR